MNSTISPPSATQSTVDRDASHAPYNAVVTAPFGFVGVRWRNDGTITKLAYLDRETTHQHQNHPLLARLARYFADPTFEISDASIRVAPVGTTYQQTVWQAIAQIPCGGVKTYGELAHELSSGARAIGGACGRNPLPLWVPCHRVVAQGGVGGFGGFSGGGSSSGSSSGSQGKRETYLGGSGFYQHVKLWLLRHEGVLPAPIPPQ